MFQSCWSCFAGFCKFSQLQFWPTLRILKPVSKRREVTVVLTWRQGQAGTQHRSRTQHQGHRCSAGPPAEEFESPHDHPTKSLRMVKRSGLDCLVNFGEMGWNCLVADQTPCKPPPHQKKKKKGKVKKNANANLKMEKISTIHFSIHGFYAHSEIQIFIKKKWKEKWAKPDQELYIQQWNKYTQQ